MHHHTGEPRRPRLRAFRLLMTGCALSMAGCAMVIDRPHNFTGAERVAGISYPTAVDYSTQVRGELQKRLKRLNRFDSATKAGVGLGVAGAGISAVFRSGLNPILGFLSFGAGNYAANQLTDPKTLGDVLNAGLSNLDCIDAAAFAAYQATQAVRTRLPASRDLLVHAINSLEQDEVQAGSDPKYAIAVQQADASIASARKAIHAIDQYLASSDVGEATVTAVNSTITAVNQELRSKAPNLDAIAQSGSIFSTFIGANANLRSQTDVSVQQVNRGFVAQGSSDAPVDPLQQRFAAHALILRNALADVPSLDVSSLANITTCKTQFAADLPVTVQPAGPVTLNPGGSVVTLSVTGKAPVRLQWQGANPAASDVQVNTNSNQISLSAAASAKITTYTFEAIDFSGKSSGVIELDVVAAGVKAPAPPAKPPRKKKPPAAAAAAAAPVNPPAAPANPTVPPAPASASAAAPSPSTPAVGPPPPPPTH